MRFNKYHVGRTRIAAAKILTKNLGFEVQPEDISPATGRNRSDWRMDIYRWELFAYRNGVPVVAGCWETLTNFVKLARIKGCSFNRDGEIISGKAD